LRSQWGGWYGEGRGMEEIESITKKRVGPSHWDKSKNPILNVKRKKMGRGKDNMNIYFERP